MYIMKSLCVVDLIDLLGRLRFHTTTKSSTRTKFLCADTIISCLFPGFIFVIVVVDDETEVMSRLSRCLQKRNEYPIYTCTLAMAEPWPSEVLFTLGELYPRQTGQHRRDCLGEDLGEGQV